MDVNELFNTAAEIRTHDVENITATEDFIITEIESAVDNGYFYADFTIYFEPTEVLSNHELTQPEVQNISHQIYDTLKIIAGLGFEDYCITKTETLYHCNNKIVEVSFHVSWDQNEIMPVKDIEDLIWRI